MQVVIGILGGMGPAATVDLFQKIIAVTPAAVEQDYLRIVIDCNPKIPDRTRAIFSQGEDPTRALIETAQNLERAGADFILIPCNTAHYFLDRVQNAVGIPIINMIAETVKELREEFPWVKRVGLMATSGTIRSKLYHNEFFNAGVEVISADETLVMEAIYGPDGIKAGNLQEKPRQLLLQAAQNLTESGAEAVIAGCTEIPLVLKKDMLPVPLLDPAEVLATVAVRKATGTTGYK